MRFEVSQKAKLPTKYGTFWIQSFREYVEDLGLGAARDLQNLEGAQDLEGGGTHAAQIPLASPREHLVVFTQHLGKSRLCACIQNASQAMCLARSNAIVARS